MAPEGDELSAFTHRDELFLELDALLAADLEADGAVEESRCSRLTFILDQYQEQSYLLDPYLERIISPVAQQLRRAIAQHVAGEGTSASGSLARTSRLCRLLYFVTKVRGYKTVVRFFPHEVTDLAALLAVFPDDISAESSDVLLDARWEVRFVLILWLSLVCMIPFGLDRFDNLSKSGATTWSRLEDIGWRFLDEPGKEREAAALLLARLMLRQDTPSSKLSDFLDRCAETLTPREGGDGPSVFLVRFPLYGLVSRNALNRSLFAQVTGIVQCLCEIVKLGRPPQLLPVAPRLYHFLSLIDVQLAGPQSIAVRKFGVKLAGRTALLMLSKNEGSSKTTEDEVPEEVEVIVQDLLDALQNKDTVVRWSAAKHLARVCSHLPRSFATQICEAILDLFSMNLAEGAGAPTDLLAVSEYTWHGACLACAEFLRRALWPVDLLQRLIEWALKALHFEQRKGIQNIGSGVRDSAAYVLWSLGRAFTAEAVRPFADEVATTLATTALFDREVHIRRAGSAAFQEMVGRLGVFPHGIDVLRIADFFTVGLRRSAFLVAAPRVAEFSEYRPTVTRHLCQVGLGHWDPDIRDLAAQALREIASSDLSLVAPLVASCIEGTTSKDSSRLHGSLLALADLAALVRLSRTSSDNPVLSQIFAVVPVVPDTALKSYSSDPILIALCRIVEHSFSASLEASSPPPWRRLLEYAMKRPSDELHVAMARALRSVTTAGDGKDDVVLLVRALKTGTPTAKQAASRIVGGVDFTNPSCASHFDEVVSHLERLATPEPTIAVETRRNAVSSLAEILGAPNSVSAPLQPDTFWRMFDAVLGGLSDQSVDQRGDVGSWVRSASLVGLASVVRSLPTVPSASLADYLGAGRTGSMVEGMVRLGLDRIDGLRETAWTTLKDVVGSLAGRAQVPGSAALQKSFAEDAVNSWRELSTTFPISLHLLEDLLGAESAATGKLADAIIEGMVLLLGSKGNSEIRQASDTFASFMTELGASAPALQSTIFTSIVRQAETKAKSPKTVLMALEVVRELLEAGAVAELEESEEGRDGLRRAMAVAMRGLNKPEPLGRVTAAVAIVVNSTAFPSQRLATLPHLKRFLSHSVPRVRTVTAESLYMVLQSSDGDTESAETLLLETDWTQDDTAERIAGEVVDALNAAWRG